MGETWIFWVIPIFRVEYFFSPTIFDYDYPIPCQRSGYGRDMIVGDGSITLRLTSLMLHKVHFALMYPVFDNSLHIDFRTLTWTRGHIRILMLRVYIHLYFGFETRRRLVH